MVPERADVPKEHVWSIENIYKDLSSWNQAFSAVERERSWPKKEDYEENIHNPEVLKHLLDELFSKAELLEKMYVYAHHRHDEDLGYAPHKEAHEKIKTLYMDFERDTSWLSPALLQLEEKEQENLLAAEELSLYHRFLERIFRLKTHTLSAKEEALLASSSKPLSSLTSAYGLLRNVDLTFPPAVDKDGKERELSYAQYVLYLQSSDPVLRKSARESFMSAYEAHENTFTELLQGKIAADVYEAEARNYQSTLDFSLYPKNIDTAVYHSLIRAVKTHIGSLHKYVSLRKKVLGLEKVRIYDMYVPLAENEEFQMSYDEARKAVIASVEPLGLEYQEMLRRGLYEERWVDVYENKRKASGAYSGGCFGTDPYILMNYVHSKGNINSVFTLAHEAGHSAHSKKSSENQPYPYAEYEIFVAEVASTFNEQLLLDYLLENAHTPKEKAFLLSYAIARIQGTLFQQTLFAEFELKLHEYVHKGVPLTPQLLRSEYVRLHEEYYGPDFAVTPELGISCVYIPHFFRKFYTYQYATGISAALALRKNLQEKADAKEKYLTFLSSGKADFPIELLEKAGVDMRSEKPVVAAISHFSSLVEALEELLLEREEAKASL